MDGSEDINNYPVFSIRRGHVCYNGIDILSEEFISNIGNFHVENGIKFYKNEPIEDIVNKLKLKEYDINNFPGFEIRCGRVCYNNRDILTDEAIYLTRNFNVVNNVKFYKNEQVVDIINKLESGEYDINNFPNWNKRFGRWCYGSRDILTDDVYLLNGSNFIIKDNIKYVLDKSIGQYIPWEDKKNEVLKRIEAVKNIDGTNNNFNKEITDLIKLENFNIEPIFNYNDDPDLWSRSLTDKYLVEQGYGWICYIKFFNNIPFIVGKTGTTLVSASPVDFDFKVGYDDKDLNYNGPGRQFIRENFPKYIGGCTDHEFVLVRNFETEYESLEFEKYIAVKYNLFES